MIALYAHSCGQAMAPQGGRHTVRMTTNISDPAKSTAPAVSASLTDSGIRLAGTSLAIECAGRGLRLQAVALEAIEAPTRSSEADKARVILHLHNAIFVANESLPVHGAPSVGINTQAK